MSEPLDFVDIELVKDSGMVVTFSDGTQASYPAEELPELRPYREPAPEPKLD